MSSPEASSPLNNMASPHVHNPELAFSDEDKSVSHDDVTREAESPDEPFGHAEHEPELKSESRRLNPVYEFYKGYVKQTDQLLRQEWENPETRSKLLSRNKGVRCFMKRSDIVNMDWDQMKQKQTDDPLDVVLAEGNQSAVDTLLQLDEPDSMVAIYSPSSSPTQLVYGGLPGEITDLAIRSTFLWQIKSPNIRLKETKYLCQLYASTSFYLPNVQVRRTSWRQNYQLLQQPQNINVTLMSNVPTVLNHWKHLQTQKQFTRKRIDLPQLIQLKLETPLYMALRQNQNRAKLGMKPIQTIVIGDLFLNYSEHGVNSLFSQKVEKIMDEFEGCFERIVLCVPSESTRMHLNAQLFET